MKRIILILMLGAFGLTAVEAHDHSKHNMVMFGEGEIYLSHIVYKVPHNYQVILKIQLSDEVIKQYKEAKDNPAISNMIFLFDHMDISQINSVKEVKGTMYSEDAEGNRKEILSNVIIKREDFQIIFFNELPLSLESNKIP